MKLKTNIWTKEEIDKVVSLWNDNSREEIAKTMNIPVSRLATLVYSLRKKGYKLDKKSNKGPIFVRLYSRVLPEQFRQFKSLAKKNKVGEGEMLRIILDNYFKNNV